MIDEGHARQLERIEADLAAGIAAAHARAKGTAVLVPLIPSDDANGGFDVLFEQRAAALATQPGEVCLPGGHVEAGETPEQAAVRETCEELLVAPSQIDVIAKLDATEGPGGVPLTPFVGTLEGYAGSFSPDEVARTFAIPLRWLLDHEPARYAVRRVTEIPDDFPFELIPGGRAYPWREGRSEVCVYEGTDPLVWGVTAHVIDQLARTLREGAAQREGR